MSADGPANDHSQAHHAAAPGRKPLAGRIALVTGAGRGIGAATVRRLAADGATVWALDRDAEPLDDVVAQITQDGGDARAVAADAGERCDMTRAVGMVRETHGRLDILAALAGHLRDAPIFRMTDEEFNDVIRVHLYGSFLAAQLCQQLMVEQRYGRMIFMSSQVASTGNPGQVNYAAAKAGIGALVKVTAQELGRFGITVNAVAPGFIATRLTDRISTYLDVPEDQVHQGFAQALPVRRVGRPGDVAGVIAFLAGEDVGFLTGETVAVTGGPRSWGEFPATR